MKAYKHFRLALVFVILAAGCSSLPGLRVLTGEESAEVASERVAENVDLVMADKTGDVNASMIESANRVEAAAGNVDIIQIRQDPVEDTYFVYLILRTEGSPQSNDTAQVIAYYDSLRRGIEITWQGTFNESQTSNFIQVEVVNPMVVTSLDQGLIYLGIKQFGLRIERDDAIEYISRPHNLDDFISLIIDGKMAIVTPQGSTLYGAQPFESPNHPAYMLPSPIQ